MNLIMNFRRAFSVLTLFSAAIIFAQNIFALDAWTKVRSNNFQLAGNAPEEDIRQVAYKIERFRATFAGLTGEKNLGSPIPTNIIVFKSDEYFRDFKPVDKDGKFIDWAIGYFQAGEDVNYIALAAGVEKNKNFSVIYHEYTHFLIDNEIGRSVAPPWFNEGLAEYYETAQIEENQKAVFGAVNDEDLRLLRQNKLIPFDKFFDTDYYSLNTQTKESAALYYAQSWALIHYLLQANNGARKSQFDKFVDFIKNGKQPKTAFSEAFETDFATMQRELSTYINQKNFNSSAEIIKTKIDIQLQTSPISEAEAKIVLGDLLFHLRRFDDAAAQFESALKSDENSSLANSSLGLIRLQQKNFPEARKYLEKAVALDEKNYLIHYQYAYVLSREGMSEYGFVSGYDYAQAKLMRDELKKAIELNSNFAQSYSLYAFISVVRNEDLEQATEYIEKALSLAPGNQWFLLRSAELLMRKEDFTGARRIALKVLQTAPDDDLRIYAQNRIDLINSLEAQLLAVKNYNDKLKSEVPDKILSDEEFARLRDLAILESINQALRKPKTNEIRVLGYLSKVECGENGVDYFVKVGKDVLRLNSKDFENLNLVSFAKEMSNVQLSCETVKNDIFAVITYRPDEKILSKTNGEMLSIEFVPQNFKFLK